MPPKPRRQAAKRRKAPARRRRPRWIVRVILMGGLLLVVFCVAAGTTLWLSEQMRGGPVPAAPNAASVGERFTAEERKALEQVLKEQKPATKP